MENLILGNSIHDLTVGEIDSSIEITGPNKNYIALLVIQNNLSVAQLARKMNLTRQCIYQWVWKYRNGHTNFSDGGRPPALDKISVAKIKRIIVHENQHEIDYLKGLCTQEHIHTVKRRSIFIPESDIKPLLWLGTSTISFFLSSCPSLN